MTTEIISDVFKCECCNEGKYSIEFADSDLFVNGKVPVCATCARSTSQRERVAAILKGYGGIEAQCKKCGEWHGLDKFFARQSDWYRVVDTCIDCRSARFN